MSEKETRTNQETFQLIHQLSQARADRDEKRATELDEQIFGKRKPYQKPDDFEQAINPVRFEITRKVLVLRQLSLERLFNETLFTVEEIEPILQELVDLGYLLLDSDGKTYRLTDDRKKQLELSESLSPVFNQELPAGEYRHR